jgi:hypothetical protein
MKSSKIILFAVFFVFAVSAYADPAKVYIEYEHTSSSKTVKIKLYKDGDKYKLVKPLSDSPGETGIVTTYIDVIGNSVISVTEKDGVKKGIKAGWSDDYFALVMQYHVLFRGVPEGKSFKSFTKQAGTETIDAKECEVYQSGITILGASTKYYMWEGIMLKAAAPDYTTNASDIDENPLFNTDEFTMPSDVDWGP